LEVTSACNVAFVRVLVASIRSLRLPVSYSARVIETVSVPEAAGLMVKVAERDVPLRDAVITALVVACTCVVLTVKVREFEPAGTITLAGTMAAALLLARVTVVDTCATAVSVTVPVEELPPVTVVGFNDKLATPRDGVGEGGGVGDDDGVGDGGGTPPVVLVKTSIVGATAAPSTKAMSGLASPFQSPARIMMPPLLGGGTR
jgi:hypothetical protein